MIATRAQILVVDDEPRYVRAIKVNLEGSGFEVITASNGIRAVEIAATEDPELIIMDLRLPGIDGYEASQRIREFSSAPILMLTAMAETADKVKGLEIGADDYLTKPFSAQELLARIRSLLRRKSGAKLDTSSSFSCPGLHVDFERQAVTVRGRSVMLTPKEYCLLCELISRPGHLFVPEYLLQNVWGSGIENEKRLVWQAVHRLRRKIEADPDNPQFIQTRIGVGYIFVIPEM